MLVRVHVRLITQNYQLQFEKKKCKKIRSLTYLTRDSNVILSNPQLHMEEHRPTRHGNFIYVIIYAWAMFCVHSCIYQV